MNEIKPDDLYEALVAMHDGLDERQSLLVNSRLVLLLCDKVRDETVLRDLIAQARRVIE
ncbi:MAG TPA: DUF2783 domain-containing protein [Arenibaculum sp.]|nr:DUF2783 domain-containing protein [Arenibaculum sp.]